MVSGEFWRGRSVFLTGHTGFKGAWMSRVLLKMGAELTGYSLPAPTQPNLFSKAGLEGNIDSVIGDIRDFEKLRNAVKKRSPEVVIHMAAQPIVRESYRNPRYTYETNVMGTVNILECIRDCESVKSFVNVTTDKVYHNREWCWGYREDDVLNGYDPYSNSKSCSELVTSSYKKSFFGNEKAAVSTARAGNVIGGGDFAPDRIIPDCIRAVIKKEPIIVRNPHSTRPYQHVLDPIFAYLMIAEKQYEDPEKYAGSYNVGPDDCDCVTTGELADAFCSAWGSGAMWENKYCGGPQEANFLKLDCSKIRTTFNWRPRWHIAEAVAKTCEWSKAWLAGADTAEAMDCQIREYVCGKREKND